MASVVPSNSGIISVQPFISPCLKKREHSIARNLNTFLLSVLSEKNRRREHRGQKCMTEEAVFLNPRNAGPVQIIPKSV
jgi:hypothetical protein